MAFNFQETYDIVKNFFYLVMKGESATDNKHVRLSRAKAKMKRFEKQRDERKAETENQIEEEIEIISSKDNTNAKRMLEKTVTELPNEAEIKKFVIMKTHGPVGNAGLVGLTHGPVGDAGLVGLKLPVVDAGLKSPVDVTDAPKPTGSTSAAALEDGSEMKIFVDVTGDISIRDIAYLVVAPDTSTLSVQYLKSKVRATDDANEMLPSEVFQVDSMSPLSEEEVLISAAGESSCLLDS